MHVQTLQGTTIEPPARIRLICLAYDRQQLMQYRTWAQTLCDPIELIAADVPPSVRLDGFDPAQPPCPLARALLDKLQPYLAQPHAIFGQGLGAHVAVALTQLAQNHHPGQTRHLFVSTYDSPPPRLDITTSLAIQVPMTVLYLPGSLPAMLGWHSLARQGLELIELPAQSVDTSLLNQRLVRIINTHLGLLSL